LPLGQGLGLSGSLTGADAEPICGAVTRPTIRVVPIKSAESQGALTHRTRELLVPAAHAADQRHGPQPLRPERPLISRNLYVELTARDGMVADFEEGETPPRDFHFGGNVLTKSAG
jgi:hypothetical protein